ncbi:threonine/serine exporter family protein [Staphylococcus chromogenes]|nr:threonine/serine exporter family protein [Staphylococcus chromogenes]
MKDNAQYQMGLAADAVIRLGMMMTGAGTSGYRVMRAMKRAARALGFDALDAVVGINQITCSFHRGHHFRTIVARSHNPAVDASRIEALEKLTHQLHRRITVDELNAELDRVETQVTKRWSTLHLALAAAIACASFAMLNHFTLLQAVLVAFAAGCGQATRTLLHHKRVHQLGCIAAAGTASSTVFFLVTAALDLVFPGQASNLTAGYVAAALFLIPGFPLFSAMIDLARFDFDAGLARLSYAMTVIVTATFVVTLVSWLTGLSPAPVESALHASVFTVAVASFAGIAGFAFLFNSSLRMILTAAVIGTIANLTRMILLEIGTTPAAAAFVAGTIIGVLGALLSKRVHLPRITTTVPAAVVLIPGVAMFKSVYYLNAGDMDQVISHAATAAFSVVAISAGLIFARLLTDSAWTYGKLIEFGRLEDN